MLIAVTGAYGTIGQAVVDLALSQGHIVRAIDRQPPPDSSNGQAGGGVAEYLKVDVTDPSACVEALRGCDAVVHLAAIVAGSKDCVDQCKQYNTNSSMSYNFLRAAAELGIKRVSQASSIHAIGGFHNPGGPVFDYFPLDESHPHYPRDPYSLSKHVAEQQAAYLSDVFGIRVASLRFHMTCRDWQHALDNRGHTDGADGKDAWDLWGWNTAGEAARACLLGLTSEGWEGHEAFYIVAPDISTNHTVPASELASKYWPDSQVRPGWWEANQPYRGFYDCSKAQKLLGFEHPPSGQL